MDKELELVTLLINTVRDTTTILTEIRKLIEHVQSTCSDLPEISRIEDLKGIILEIDKQMEELTRYRNKIGDVSIENNKKLSTLLNDLQNIKNDVLREVKVITDFINGDSTKTLIENTKKSNSQVNDLHVASVRQYIFTGLIAFIMVLVGYFLTAYDMKNRIVEGMKPINVSMEKFDKATSGSIKMINLAGNSPQLTQADFTKLQDEIKQLRQADLVKLQDEIKQLRQQLSAKP